MHFRGKLIFLTLVYAIYLAAFGAFAWWHQAMMPASRTAKPVIVKIANGSSFKMIAAELQKKGVIRSKDAFYVLAWLGKRLSDIKAGEYKLSPAMSPDEILDILVSGKVVQHLITIPEGYNMFQIASLLDRAGLAKKKAFLEVCTDKNFLSGEGIHEDSAEGFLFPESYYLTKNSSSREIAATFIKQFMYIWKSNGFDKRAAEMGSNMHEIVTLASIVELEAAVAREKPLIAGVFWNRIKLKMPLQADPTVKYGVMVEKRINRKRLTWKDLRKSTPYNTYTLKGLPKGPICNPGIDSLQAILYPKDTRYLFFVSKGNRTHYFSRTLKEHNRAVDKYIRHK